jgi:hypothetical protein
LTFFLSGCRRVGWLSFRRIFGLKQFFEGIKPGVPEGAGFLDPMGDFVERLGPEGHEMFSPDTPASHQAGAFQDTDVLRDGRQRHGKGLGQLRDARLVPHEPLQDRPPCRVGECRHRDIEWMHFLKSLARNRQLSFNHMV